MTKEYKITDYIELIKQNKFFAGYIEIFCCSRIYKTPIIILETIEINNKEYYKVNTSFKDINDIKENFNIEDVIFVLYKNKIHYDYLKINKTFILQQIISSFNNNQQLILEKNELNSTSDKKENYNLSSIKKLIKNEKNTENKNNSNELKKIININNHKERRNLKRKDINKDFKEPKKVKK